MVLFLPLAFLFAENKFAYLVTAGIVGLVVVTPLAGLLFEVFADNSERIGRDAPNAV
jgi:hypothetical protein